MEQNTEMPKINFRYLGFINMEFSQIGVDPDASKTDEFLNRLIVNVNGKTNIDPEQKHFVALLEVQFLYFTSKEAVEKYDLTDTIPIVKHISLSKFFVENFDEIFVKSENGRYQADKRFGVHLLSIAISTIRGVLLEKMANSPLSHLILPAISTDTIRGIASNDPTD